MSQQICDAIEQRITESIPGSQVDVAGGGGHYTIRVVSEAFANKRTLAKHRMVLMAIQDLMDGDNAPVHAVDRIMAETP